MTRSSSQANDFFPPLVSTSFLGEKRQKQLLKIAQNWYRPTKQNQNNNSIHCENKTKEKQNKTVDICFFKPIHKTINFFLVFCPVHFFAGEKINMKFFFKRCL